MSRMIWLWAALMGSAVHEIGYGAASELSFEQCLQEAATHNKDLEAFDAQERSAKFAERGAYAGFFPQATLSLSALHGNSTTAGISLGTTTNFYTATAAVSQNLFSGLRDLASVRRASANHREAEANRSTLHARVFNDVRVAFARALFAQKLIQLQTDIIHRRAENLRLVELRFEGGRENKGSVLLSKAYLSQSQFEKMQATNTVQSASADLAQLMGRNTSEAGALQDIWPPSLPTERPADFYALARATPDYRAAEAREEAADAAITIAQSAFFPTLDVSASHSAQDTVFFPQSTRWQFGVSLSWPIFSGGRDYYATKSARETWKSAEATRDNTVRTLNTRLMQAYFAFIEAAERAKVDEQFRAAAQVRAEIGRSRYNNGLLTFDQWDIIESDLILRQRAALASRRDQVIAEAAWLQVQGVGIPKGAS